MERSRESPEEPVGLGVLARSEPVGTAAALLLLVALALLFRAYRDLGSLRARLDALTPPGMAALESRARTASDDASMALTRVDELSDRLTGLQEDLQATIQRVGVVRFNPFRDTGGDQSFAVALLDELGNGVVLSSLHNRNDTRVFAKPVHGGTSPYALSDEEHQAIAKANRLLALPGDPPRARATPSSAPS